MAPLPHQPSQQPAAPRVDVQIRPEQAALPPLLPTSGSTITAGSRQEGWRDIRGITSAARLPACTPHGTLLCPLAAPPAAPAAKPDTRVRPLRHAPCITELPHFRLLSVQARRVLVLYLEKRRGMGVEVCDLGAAVQYSRCMAAGNRLQSKKKRAAAASAEHAQPRAMLPFAACLTRPTRRGDCYIHSQAHDAVGVLSVRPQVYRGPIHGHKILHEGHKAEVCRCVLWLAGALLSDTRARPPQAVHPCGGPDSGYCRLAAVPCRGC